MAASKGKTGNEHYRRQAATVTCAVQWWMRLGQHQFDLYRAHPPNSPHRCKYWHHQSEPNLGNVRHHPFHPCSCLVLCLSVYPQRILRRRNDKIVSVPIIPVFQGTMDTCLKTAELSWIHCFRAAALHDFAELTVHGRRSNL